LNQAFGSYLTYISTKKWHLVDVSGSAFKTAAGVSHEFKFGFGYNRRPSDSLTHYSGNSVFAINNGGGDTIALVYRDRVVSSLDETTNIYFGDTLSKGRLTLNLGVRWDRQLAKNLPSVAPANGDFPTILPSVNYDGSGPTITWKDISPRASATVALDETRKSVVRGAYARYAGQLYPAQVTLASPVGSYYSYIAYRWNDANGNHLADKNEVLTGLGPLYWGSGIDIKNPGAAVQPPQQIDSKYSANHDDEIIIGFDRELMPNLGLSIAYTYHRSSDIPGWNPRVGMTSADYTANAVTTANGLSAQSFSPIASKIDAANGARILMNRPDFHTAYSGFEISLNKRLADRWFSRVAFSYNDYAEHYGAGSVQNPSRTDVVNGSLALAGPQVQGGQYAPRSGGSGKGDIFYNAKWQLNANAMYQFPHDIEVGGNIFGRQGYASPYHLRLSAGRDGAVRALATSEVDTNRYPNLWDLDLRVAKDIKIANAASSAGPFSVKVALDMFNVMNSNTVLARGRQANSSAFLVINDILSPRILRFTASFRF